MSDTPTATTPAAKPETYTISFTQASLKYLREITNSTQWATSLALMRHGGDAFEVMPEPETEPVLPQFYTAEALAAHRVAVKAWADKPAASFVLTPKQRKAVKACVEFYSTKATLPPGRYSNAIFDTFGVKIVDDLKED